MGTRYYVQGGIMEYIFGYSCVASSEEEAIEKYYAAFTRDGYCRAASTLPYTMTEVGWPSGCQPFEEVWQHDGATYESGGYDYSF